MKNLFKNEQSGRSMVEMLGVLAIIGVLSVGGISGYSKAMAKFKLTKAQDQITMMIMNIRTAYATSPGYGGLTNAVAVTYGLVPSEMIKDANAGTLMNAFGGTTTITAVEGADKTAGGAFAITFAGIGKDACLSLATSDWGADGLAGLSFDVAGGVVNAHAVSKSVNDLPLSLGTMTGAAAPGCKDPSNNSITWVYF